MPFMLKIQWDLKEGREADFKANQETLCEVMYDHPGVICYHVDYPSEGVSQWTEIYATDESFKAHLANEKGKAPLGVCIDASAKITCRCWGDPDAGSKEILAQSVTSTTSLFAANRRATESSRPIRKAARLSGENGMAGD